MGLVLYLEHTFDSLSAGLGAAAPRMADITIPLSIDEPEGALPARGSNLHATRETGSERRLRPRYGIHLPLRYKIVRDALVTAAGTGDTIDMSSKGIAFRCASVFKRRTPLELSVSWPILLNGTCPIQLIVRGSVIRSELKSTVVGVNSHEFRTNAGGNRRSIPSPPVASTPLERTPLFRLADVLPELADEMRDLLFRQGQRPIGEQVANLLIYNRCRCGSDRCATLHTLPKVEDALSRPSKILRLFPENGDILVHTVTGCITSIEVMDRSEIRAKLVALFP